METVAFCEIDKKARQVLAKHWPNVPIFEDVTTLTAEALHERNISVDVICGGFPCQDISLAGKGAGIEGKRSGLWSEYARLIGELRPRYAIVENVSALLNRGLDRVLGDLSKIGYDAEWHCIPASAVGAPHRRDRIWIVGYPNSSYGRLPTQGNLEGDLLGQARWGESQTRLSDQVVMIPQTLPTPCARDWKDSFTSLEKLEAQFQKRDSPSLALTIGSIEKTASGKLNPQWVEWLMGFPVGWTDLNNSETP
jgi:DNA-cytosine methyltransferase